MKREGRPSVLFFIIALRDLSNRFETRKVKELLKEPRCLSPKRDRRNSGKGLTVAALAFCNDATDKNKNCPGEARDALPYVAIGQYDCRGDVFKDEMSPGQERPFNSNKNSMAVLNGCSGQPSAFSKGNPKKTLSLCKIIYAACTLDFLTDKSNSLFKTFTCDMSLGELSVMATAPFGNEPRNESFSVVFSYIEKENAIKEFFGAVVLSAALQPVKSHAPLSEAFSEAFAIANPAFNSGGLIILCSIGPVLFIYRARVIPAFIVEGKANISPEGYL